MRQTLYYKNFIVNVLKSVDVQVGGNRPWDIAVLDDAFYKKIYLQGSIGLGESFMDGLWTCRAPDELLFRIIQGDLKDTVSKNLKNLLYALRAKLFNLQTKRRARMVAQKHYNLGNELYRRMLDERMIYSCAYWQNAGSLEDAQLAKLDLICRKLKLLPGQKLLDIGCGWGGFARYAAEKYQVSVLGITISQDQAVIARQACAGFPVEIRVQDYRTLNDSFDRIVSIGMFEHVGYKNYEIYMKTVLRCLNPQGLFLLHCIGSNESVHSTDPWINKYIFPNGMMPSIAQIGKAIEKKFILEDWQNIGPYYDPTLMEWLKRFKRSWPDIQHSYDERFYNMWVYYLSCSAASFRAKRNDLWQLVLSRSADNVFYQSVR